MTLQGNAGDELKLENVLNYQTRVFGCTIFKIDKIMHGIQVGSMGMFGQVKEWAGQDFFIKCIDKLISEKFHIYITSDHGNTEAIGIGAPKEGALCDKKGERSRVYSDQILRNKVHQEFHNALCWDHQGLPKDYHCLIAPQGKSFTQKDLPIVCHGGISLDEVMVPFVELKPKEEKYGE